MPENIILSKIVSFLPILSTHLFFKNLESIDLGTDVNEKMLSLTVEMWDCGGRAVSPFLIQFKYVNEILILIDNIVEDFLIDL